jgi:hypothetical protein
MCFLGIASITAGTNPFAVISREQVTFATRYALLREPESAQRAWD